MTAPERTRDAAPVAPLPHDPRPDPDAAAELFATLALAAGARVMRIYSRDHNARVKADRSPVCDADIAAERILLDGLAEHLPDVPVVSEEAASRGEIPATGDCFILVDPLDGTREFLAANGEFTINVALIVDGAPVAGVVYAPAINRLWMAGSRAWSCDAAPGGALPQRDQRRRIVGRAIAARLVALVSRSHPDAPSEAFLERMPIGERKCAGSSLKFCLLAEGQGDVYPRCGPTMQWDVAAGDAVLRAAGGLVVDEEGRPVTYGPRADGFRNGPFVAWGDAAAARGGRTLRSMKG